MNRIGFGFDSHRFEDGRPLVLGGVTIDSARGLAGHSDADAVLHAVTDALLGAVAAGDIGEWFPNTDPQWQGADSARFVAEAMAVVTDRGLRVANCDVTAESPKLGPVKPQMQSRIAELLAVDETCIAVKAKTGEGMGFIGHGEGIAVMAAVLLTDE